MPATDYMTKPMMDIKWADFDALHATLSNQLVTAMPERGDGSAAAQEASSALVHTFDPSLTAPGWLVAAGVHLNVSTDHIVANLVIPL
jgi:hypothetical protein